MCEALSGGVSDVGPWQLRIFLSLPSGKDDPCVKYKPGLFARKVYSCAACFWVKKNKIHQRLPLVNDNWGGVGLTRCDVNVSCDLASVGIQPEKAIQISEQLRGTSIF